MNNQPDFIVDPSGDVQDVRQRKNSVGYQAIPNQETGGESSSGRKVVHQYRAVTDKPKGKPVVILIPIGLILTIIIALLKWIHPSTRSQNYSESEVSDLRSGNYNLVEGDYEMALIYFNMALQANPDFGEAYISRGLLYYIQREPQNAIADFDRAIELLPDSAEAYNNRGITYHGLGAYDQAIQDLDKALQIDNTFAKAYYNRGLAHLALGNFDLAIDDFDQAIQYTPEEGAILFNFLTPGPEKEGFASIHDYWMIHHDLADLPMTYFNRGLAYYYQGDSDHASADLEKALALGLDPVSEQQANILLGK